MNMDKRCPRCGEYKPRSEYYPRTGGGVFPWCKPCHNARYQPKRIPGMRRCPCCKEFKPVSDYGTNGHLRNGRPQYRGDCAACREAKALAKLDAAATKPPLGGGPIYRGA